MPSIENLIFSGGGVKGIGYGAVLTVLESLGALDHVRGYAGTSAGAMVACLLAVGYSGAELRNMLLYEHTPEQLIGEISPLRLLLDSSAYGFSSGERVLTLLRQKIRDKLGDTTKVTFAWIRSALGKDVRVFVTNLNLGRSQELSADTEPDMEVALAVRASISLPVIFDPVVYRGDYLVDGGMLNNFPSHVFPPHNSLGFIFVHQLAGAEGSTVPSRDRITSRLEFLSQLMVCTMRDSRIRDHGGLAICEIEVGDTTSRDFELTMEERFQLDWLAFKSVFVWLASLKRNP
jgi:predicted acylesterase/phospholipase RssA